jgi:hypothetical protein
MKSLTKKFILTSFFAGTFFLGFYLGNNQNRRELDEARGLNYFYEMSLKLEKDFQDKTDQIRVLDKIAVCKERVARDLAIHALLNQRKYDAVSNQIENSLLDELYCVEDYLELPNQKRISSPAIISSKNSFYFLKSSVREYLSLSTKDREKFLEGVIE